MWRKLESLRKEPKEVRNRYAFWYAFMFTAIIGVFWITSIPARVHIISDESSVDTADIDGGFARMFSSMKASVMSVKNEAVPEVDSVPAETRNEPIPVDQFIASSTSSKSESTEGKPGTPILISTSSAATKTPKDVLQ